MDYVIQDCWTMISQDLVDTAIDQFSKRLTLVIRGQGGHIEHRLNLANKAYTDSDKILWHSSKLILLESVSTDIYKVPHFD